MAVIFADLVAYPAQYILQNILIEDYYNKIFRTV